MIDEDQKAKGRMVRYAQRAADVALDNVLLKPDDNVLRQDERRRPRLNKQTGHRNRVASTNQHGQQEAYHAIEMGFSERHAPTTGNCLKSTPQVQNTIDQSVNSTMG